MFETLVSRLTSPTASRRRHSYHQSAATREVQSDPETEEQPVTGRGARPLLERRKRARRATPASGDSPRGMAALRAFLPLRPSKSLGRLDGIKEIERLAQYERLAGGGAGTGAGSIAGSGAGNGGSAAVRRRGQRLSDLERVQHLFPNDFLALHEHDVIAATAGTLKTKALLRKRPSLEAAVGAGVSGLIGGGSPSTGRQFLMEAPCTLAAAQAVLPAASPNTHSQDRHLFLFTDLLLVAKSRGNNSFKLKEAVRLSEMWVAAGNADTSFMLGWPGSGAPTNSSPPTTYIVTYPTQAARDSWLRKIQNALNSQLTFEPKTTNIQIVYKDSTNGIEFGKTLSVTPEMTTAMVIRQALQLVQGGVVTENGSSWGPARDFCLWAKASRESTSIPLIGCERPHAIQMARIRQTLSNEEGFDLEHVNSRNNPCGMIFELRKINKNIAKPKTPLKLFKGVSSGKLFGVALGRLCVNGVLPPTVLTMLRAVHRRGPLTQGIFRKSANVRALKHLREKVDSMGVNGARCPELDSAPVLLVASLLKDFLRSLPQPLMCDTFYPGWISILGLTSQEKILSMRSLLLKLPKPHYNLLSHFIALLQAIARKSSINLMCPMNLAVCVGPSLLWPTHPCETAPKAVPLLIELLIIHAETLFGPQVNSIFGKGSPEPSASLSLDSGAEESDSLHSVGLSLDSLDLTCPRKEKLSLSRDSGLTLSEDDSNSNGGNSPAPRNGQVQQVLPQTGIRMHQAQKVYAKCYTTDLQNVTGLPKATIGNYDVARKRNMFAKSNDVDIYGRKIASENIYGTNADVKKTIESQQKIYNAITAQNHYNSNYHDAQGIYGTANQTNNMNNNRIVQNGLQSNTSLAHNNNSSPSKYLTGYEPEKPPRLGLSRATRSAKVQSMHVENANQHNLSPARLYCRAKSSEDLLERRNDRVVENIYGTRGSQENIYGNVNYDNRQRHIRPKLQKSQTQFDSEKLNPSLQSYSRVYGGWEERVSKLTNNSLYKNESSYSKDAFLINSNEAPPENIYDAAPGMSKRMVHHQQDCGQPPNSTVFTRKDWSRQASRTKSLEVSAPDDVYLPGDYHAEEDNQNMPIYLSRNEITPINQELRGGNSNQRHGNQCKMRSVDPAHVCTKNCSSLNMHNDISDLQKNQGNPLQNSHSMKNIPQNCRTVETKKCSPVSKMNTRKVNNTKFDKNPYGNKLVHSKSLANIVLHSNSSSNDTLYQPSNKYMSHDSPASSENSASNHYSSEYSDHIYGTARHIDVFCENIYGRMGSRDAIYSSDIYTAKPTSVGNINKSENDHQNSLNNSPDHKIYDGNIGRNLPIPPPVPPRKGSHNSPLKNLPPVHLINDDRKTRSKSTSSHREPSQEGKTIHSLSDENTHVNLRAPITSYHMGKSEKFILALEDSGTDTESESYV